MTSIHLGIESELNSRADTIANFFLTPYRKAFGTIAHPEKGNLDFTVEKVSTTAKVAFALLSIFATLPGLIAYAIGRFDENPEIQKLYTYYSVRPALDGWLSQESESAQIAIKTAVRMADASTKTLSMQNGEIKTFPQVVHPFFQSLEKIDLSQNQITTLPENMNYPQLRQLNLSQNQITNSSVEIQGLSKTCEVILNGNYWTAVKIKEFREKNSTLNVNCTAISVEIRIDPPSINKEEGKASRSSTNLFNRIKNSLNGLLFNNNKEMDRFVQSNDNVKMV